jgi:hypothetical protein
MQLFHSPRMQYFPRDIGAIAARDSRFGFECNISLTRDLSAEVFEFSSHESTELCCDVKSRRKSPDSHPPDNSIGCPYADARSERKYRANLSICWTPGLSVSSLAMRSMVLRGTPEPAETCGHVPRVSFNFFTTKSKSDSSMGADPNPKSGIIQATLGLDRPLACYSMGRGRPAKPAKKGHGTPLMKIIAENLAIVLGARYKAVPKNPTALADAFAEEFKNRIGRNTVYRFLTQGGGNISSLERIADCLDPSVRAYELMVPSDKFKRMYNTDMADAIKLEDSKRDRVDDTGGLSSRIEEELQPEPSARPPRKR